MEEEEVMLQIGNALVSLDLAERFFCCDLDACKGQCCIEGDAGAPVTEEEVKEIEGALPVVKRYMLPDGIKEVEKHGCSYIDSEGDLVTTIVDGRDCAFTCRGEGGICLCAIEKARRSGETNVEKPISCALYPLRLTEYPTFTAVNYHRWSICRPAEEHGKKIGMRLYQFLEGPLTRRFGKEWYEELALACETYLEENENSHKFR